MQEFLFSLYGLSEFFVFSGCHYRRRHGSLRIRAKQSIFARSYEDFSMHNVDDAIRKQVVNMVVSIPGHIRGMEVSCDGTVLVGLQSDGDLLITIKDPAKEHSESSILKGPVHRFALRPTVNELAVARQNSASIERYALHGVLNPKKARLCKSLLSNCGRIQRRWFSSGCWKSVWKDCCLELGRGWSGTSYCRIASHQ